MSSLGLTLIGVTVLLLLGSWTHMVRTVEHSDKDLREIMVDILFITVLVSGFVAATVVVLLK